MPVESEPGSVPLFLNPKIWSFVALLAPVSGARAQETAPPRVPPVSSVSPALAREPEVALDELLRLARQNNPQLPIARGNLEAAQQRAGAARGLLNPTLQVVPRLLGSNQAADTEIIVSQPLDVFGRRRAGAKVLAAQVRGAQAASLLAERNLIVQVKNAAADLFAAQEAENLGAFQVEVAFLFRNAAARRAQLGDVPEVQWQRADLELLRVRNELTTARAERLARRAALNGIIGQAPETPLRVALPIASDFTAVLRVPTVSRPGFSPNLSTGNSVAASPDGPAAGGKSGSLGGIPATPPAPNQAQAPAGNFGAAGTSSEPILGSSSQVGSDLVAQRAALLPDALGRPDIVGAQANLEARQAQVNAIARQRYPDIELQLRRGSFFGQGENSTALRAVITVPIFDFGSIGREKKAAQAEVRAGQAELVLLRQQAATQVEQALIRLEQQRQTVEIYRTGIVPQTLDLLRKTQIGYAAGASTYLEVLDAQRTLRQVQTEYLQALVGTRTSEAALESALGAAPPANLIGSLLNPSGAAALPGTAAPGTVPEGVIPSNPIDPLDPSSSTLPDTSAPMGQGAIPNLAAPMGR